MNEIILLEKNGWVVECESPFQIRHENGSFASGLAVELILKSLKEKVGNKKIIENDLKNWDVYEAPTGNIFIKFGDSYAIAIGTKNNLVPDKKNVWSNTAECYHDVYTLPCVKSESKTLEVKKIGKVKFKK